MMLRSDPHPRGHLAHCNGDVDKVGAVVEQCYQDISGKAAITAAQIQEWSERERKRKAQRLVEFQRRVRSRVNARERLMQREMAYVSSKNMQCEQAAAERAVKLDNTKIPHSVEVGLDVEDVKVVASGRESRLCKSQGSSSSLSLQAAREALLSVRVKQQLTTSNTRREEQGPHVDLFKRTAYNNRNYQSVQQMSFEACTRRISSDSQRVSESNTSARSTPSPPLPPSHQKMVRLFRRAGELEHLQKKQAGKQFLIFRRLYSELEREQARRKKQETCHTQKMESIKKKKEVERRMVEEELVGSMDLTSTISSDTVENRQHTAEWKELVFVEARRHGLQKAKETERYVSAMKARLRDQSERGKFTVPPLCSCGSTVWDTDPKTCANNCLFYRNTKAYAKALSNLLQSLNLQA